MTDETNTTQTEEVPDHVRLVQEIEARYAMTEAELAEATGAVLATIPKHLQPLVPKNLTTAQKLKWFAEASATGVFGGAGNVPETDRGKATITPKTIDPTNLPPLAKMAFGYGRK